MSAHLRGEPTGVMARIAGEVADDNPRTERETVEMDRRELLRLAGWLGLAPLFAGGAGCDDEITDQGDGFPHYEYEGEPGPEGLFQHSVASGDPLPTAVILWTRLTPGDTAPVDVWWEIAADSEFESRVNVGWFTTEASRDFSVKVDATGLEPGRTYYYRFMALGRTSPIGRTRTAPVGEVDQARFVVLCGAKYTAGHYHGYHFISERDDLDAVVHVGDYIYEGGGRLREGEREHDPPHECVTLEDYRTRYAQYRSDPNLQAAHQQHPFIVVWDDHESSNNSWRDGAQGHDDAGDGPWPERRAASERAFKEWVPIRESADGRIFRTFRYGSLLDLIMLDTRLWGRDRQADAITDYDALRDPDRTILGFDQEEWLSEQLTTSTAQWKVIGQQVMFGHLKARGAPNAEGGGDVVNVDQWDGYQPARDRIFELLKREGLDDVVVLSGDIHSSWAMDLTEDPNNPESYDPETGEGSLAVEFVCPGISSGFDIAEASVDFFRNLVLQANPHIKWLDISHRGYFVFDVTPERAQASWYLLDTVEAGAAQESLAAVWLTESGANRLVQG